MAFYSSYKLQGSGSLNEEISGSKVFNFYNSNLSSKYFNFEAIRLSNGFYNDTSQKINNAIFSNLVNLTQSYIITSSNNFSIILGIGSSSFTITPSQLIPSNSCYMRATGNTNLSIGGDSCPLMTIYDISNSSSIFIGSTVNYKIGNDFSESVSGGVAPYYLSIVSGSLPNGLSLFYDSSKQIWKISGTATTFGSKTFIISGIDSVGCPITPKQYTIEVWFEGSYIGPTNIIANQDNIFTIPVTGIPGTLGAGKLVSVEFNITYPELGNIGCFIESPSINLYPSNTLFSLGYSSQGLDMTGANLINCIIYNKNIISFPDAIPGGAPYTGTFNDKGNYDSGYYDLFLTGSTINGNWKIHLESIIDSGSVNSLKITIKP
jgi:hypothetical protein